MKKFNVAGASFRTEKIDFVLEKYYKDESKQNSNWACVKKSVNKKAFYDKIKKIIGGVFYV